MITADSFAGIWQAQFQGKTFATITLINEGGALNGTISHFSIQVDKAGELSGAEATSGENLISSATLKGDALLLTSTNPDSQDVVRYQMRLTGVDLAELQVLGTPADGVTPKPWSLVRGPAAAQSRGQDIKRANWRRRRRPGSPASVGRYGIRL